MEEQRFDDEFAPQSPWLDLVNSQQWDGFGGLTDHLDDPEWLVQFLEYWATQGVKLAGGAPRSRLKGLRRLLRDAIERLASGKNLDSRQIHALNAVLKAPGYMQLVTTGRRLHSQFTPVRFGWSWIQAQIALSFIETLQEDFDRIKVCQNDQCRWAFLDSTKGNNRRWCNDRRCGNRDRVRRARARMAASRRDEPH